MCEYIRVHISLDVIDFILDCFRHGLLATVFLGKIICASFFLDNNKILFQKKKRNRTHSETDTET